MERYALRPNERVTAVVRRHAMTCVVPLLFLFGILLLDVFFMAQLFMLGTFGVSVFFGLIALLAIAAVRVWILWKSNTLILTTMRVIDVDRSGFFSWTVSEADIDDLQDVVVHRRGLLDVLARTGTLEMQTANGMRLEFPRIPRPFDVRTEMTQARDRLVGREAPDEDDAVGTRLKTLPERERRAVEKYVNHLHTKQALKEFAESKDSDR